MCNKVGIYTASLQEGRHSKNEKCAAHTSHIKSSRQAGFHSSHPDAPLTNLLWRHCQHSIASSHEAPLEELCVICQDPPGGQAVLLRAGLCLWKFWNRLGDTSALPPTQHRHCFGFKSRLRDRVSLRTPLLPAPWALPSAGQVLEVRTQHTLSSQDSLGIARVCS